LLINYFIGPSRLYTTESTSHIHMFSSSSPQRRLEMKLACIFRGVAISATSTESQRKNLYPYRKKYLRFLSST
ncbi:hypothetical protein ACJX0J_032404, partial [Zea mays]